VDAQSFALLGTLIGVFTIIIGIGPRTITDIVYHVAIAAVLVWGLALPTMPRRQDCQAVMLRLARFDERWQDAKALPPQRTAASFGPGCWWRKEPRDLDDSSGASQTP
jgi:hypothetical protein